MSDFVRKPLLQKMNKKNIVSAVEKLERGAGVRPTASVDLVSEIALDAGNLLGENINPYPIPNSAYLAPVSTDFQITNSADNFIFETIGVGTNARIVDDSTNGHYGIFETTQSGANTGGLARLNTGNLTFNLIPPSPVFECIFRCPVSDVDTVIQGGWMDSISTTDSTDGIYFEYTSVAARTQISGNRVVAGAKTSITVTSAVFSDTTWFKVQISVSDIGEATFTVSENVVDVPATKTLDVSAAIGLTAVPMIKAFNTSAGSVALAQFDYVAAWSNARIRL